MRRTVVLLALLLVPGTHAAPLGGTPVVFVAAEDDSRLVALYTSGSVLRRIPVAPGPHNVAVGYPRLRPLVLVSSPPSGVVTLVDARSRRVVKVLRGFGYPHDVEVAPRSRWGYITDERRGQVAVVSLLQRRVVRRVAVGPSPHDLAVSPDGRSVWVTHDPPQGITILDTSRPARPRVVGSGGGRFAHDIAFSRDGRFVWVTYWNSGAVGEIRVYPRTGRLRLQERVGTLVHHVQADETTDDIWATDHMSGETFRLAGRSGRVLRTFGGCPGAHHVATVGTVAVVVACHDADAVAVYDRETGRRSLLPVGNGPHGVAVAVL